MAGGRAAEPPGWLKAIAPWGIVAVLIGFAVFVVLRADPGKPREGLCGQAETLRRARLLEPAREAFAGAEAAGERCAAARRAQVEAGLGEAERTFVAARAFAAVEPSGATTPAQEEDEQRIANRAFRRYVAGLGVNPFDEAARLGLATEIATLSSPTGARAARSRCRQAESLRRAALLDYASTVVAKGLGAARADCRRALVAIGRQQQAAAGRARGAAHLERIGASGTAVREAYAAALRLNAQLGAARSGLEGRLEEESRIDAVGDWLSSVPATLKSALDWILPLAGLALLATVGLGVLFRLLTRSRRISRQLTRRRSPTWLSRLATPRIAVAEFDGGSDSALAGKDFSSLLAESLPRPGGREPPFPFDRASQGSESDQEAAKLADMLADVPQGKVVGGALKLADGLFRRRRITVGGHLLPISGARGAGVTVNLEGSLGSAESSVTLWEGEYDPRPGGAEGPTRWLLLVAAAKVWARWQIAARALPEGYSSRWKADAQFQAALAWQAQDEERRAEALYLSALELDPTLLPAAHNLAVLAVRDGRYDEARERLRGLERDLGRDPSLRDDWPLLTVGYLYTRILAYAYDGGGEANERAALATAEQLIGMIAGQLEAGPAAQPGAGAFAELERTEIPSFIVLASLIARCDRTVAREAVQRIQLGTVTGPIGRADVRRELGKLKPWQLIDGYVLRQPQLSRRALYNLACYYTSLSKAACRRRRGTVLDRAAERLKQALLGRPEWIDDAREDPTLAPLRADKRWEGVEAFATAHAIEPHPDPGAAKSDPGAAKSDPGAAKSDPGAAKSDPGAAK